MSPRPYGLTIIDTASGYGVPEFLARQLGIPYVLADTPESGGFPVVCSLSVAEHARAGMEAYVRRGGVLVTADAWALSLRARAGVGLVVPIDISAFGDAITGRRIWQLSGYTPDATALVPCAAANHLRLHTQWRAALRTAFAHVGLPLLHAWYFPGDARTHVNVRVDADWYDEREWAATCDLLAPLGASSSWFLTCADLDGKPERLARLQQSGVEIGSHAYRHYTFRDEPNNVVNMRRADACLRSLGVEVHSMVTPSAKWNNGVQRTVEALGYGYSSEFGFAHDAYPCDPPCDGRISTALQVPVHAVSPINFRKWNAKTPATGIVEYYRRLIPALHGACLPVHLYGHPSDLPLLSGGGIIEAIQALPSTSVSTLHAYAQWWRSRSKGYDITFDSTEGRVVIQQSGLHPDVRLCVWQNDATVSLVSASQFAVQPNGSVDGAVTHAIHVADLPELRPVSRTLTLRSKIGEWLDYEKIIPSKEYVASDPRTLVNAVVKRMTGL